MLQEFNEGRSKTFYCIASTVLEIEELENALREAEKRVEGLNIKEKAKVLHQILDNIAERKNYYLKLRKWKSK
jgi:acyl-CoA reductase-like NAD-dependent aldehyde dehydrogenase